MVTTVQAQRISFKTLFKIIYIGNLIFPSLLLVLLSLLSFFGFEVLKFDGAYLTGTDGLFKGLITLPFMFLFALIWSVFFWVSYTISLWIYSRWRPMNLSFVTVDGHDLNEDSE